MKRTSIFVLAGLAVAVALAVFVSPFASSEPDGLEKVARDQGFDVAARDHDLAASPVADYGVEGIRNEKVGTGAAGLIGVAVTFGLALGTFAAVRARRDRSKVTT